MGRLLKWIVILGLLAGAGWLAFKWYRTQGPSSIAFSLIPSDAVYCITTSDPIESWKRISNSQAWSHLQKNAYFASLTAAANSLDSTLRDNDLLFKLIGSRSLVVSAHMVGPKKYDFLFLVDLQQVSGIKFINEYLTDFTAQGYSIRKEKYKGEDLVTLHSTSGGSDLFLSLPGSYLIISFTKKIITAALDAQQDKHSLAETRFMEVESALQESDLFQLYVNYRMLQKFMACYSDGTNEYVYRLSQTLITTSLAMTLEEEIMKATGYTYVNDSLDSYPKTLLISGKAPTEFLEIAPQRTAFCLGLGFTSFDLFYKNFEKNLQQDVAEYKTYRENLKQVESYLNISIQKDFIDWIDDEVGVFELQSSGKGLDNEVAVVLKAKNIEQARKSLAHVEKMVRRKTPVKFKTVDYKGYSIEYLSMKGLFKVLLGKFFARYDKPYYTIIDKFVVFSNHPQALESMIDDYLNKETLAKSEEFKEFRSQFENESSAWIYFNTPVFFNTLKKMMDVPTRTSMEKNKEYIVCFRQVGFQLLPESGRFKTIFAEQFVGPPPSVVQAQVQDGNAIYQVDSVLALTEAQPEPDPVVSEPDDPMQLPYIYVQNLNSKSFKEYLADSTVHFEVSLKNGFKEGTFTEYYESGEKKMIGHFKQDKRQGTWHLYDENGKLKMKRNYDEGEVKKEKIRD